MADVFISYAKVDRTLTERLAADLERRGYTVWWDTSLLGGEQFRPVIAREIDAARFVIVIWTPASVSSVWVTAEAERGHAQGKLLPVRAQTLNPATVPMPFGVYHTELIDNRDRIAAALENFGSSQHVTAPPEVSPARAPGWKPQIETWPDGVRKSPGARPLAGTTFKDALEAPLLVVVPSGGFVMGSAITEVGRTANEGPAHRVRISTTLAVGKFPITFAEWDVFCERTGSAHRADDAGWGRERRPVINISIEDARAYCTWLSNATGRFYRLLTEAEWEYCCRAGTTLRFNTGDVITAEQANFNASALPQAGSNTYRARTTPVGQFPENAFGLSDMHGNVCEWVEDPWHDDYVGAPADGGVWDGIPARHVLRGGSWLDQPQHVRSARRAWAAPSERAKNIGFRVCRAI
jgi:formylglycine-generating enzyme required for sulfatase activity